MSLGEGVPQHIGDEVQVRRAVHLGDDQGVEVGRLEHRGEIREREARGYGVDAHAELGDVRRSRLREEREDVLPRGGFLGRRHRVLEVVGYRVYGEAPGFLQESGGGGWDCEELEEDM